MSASHTLSLRAVTVLLYISSFAANSCAQRRETASDAKLQSRPLYEDIQRALDTLTRAEIAREDASLTGDRSEQLDAVRQQCREAISQFGAIETELSKLLRQTYQQRPSQRDANSWTVRELESLGRNLKVQFARAYRIQALCYPAGSPDRASALSLALARLPEVVMQPLNDASVWQARVEQVACLRLANNAAEARRQIERWRDASPPADVSMRLSGEMLHLELDAGAIDRALDLVDSIASGRKAATVDVPETDDAILATLLAASSQSDGPQSNKYIQRALEQLHYIATAHGAYWQRRAKFRMGRALSDWSSTDDPELLDYAAASLYAAGRPLDAIATYDRVAQLFAARGDVDRQFQAEKTAAAIVREDNQPAAALTRFRKLALDHRQHNEAASMHLIAIGLAADLSRRAEQPQRGQLFEHYLQLLHEHLKQWPKQPPAAQVQQWLSRAELPEIDRVRAQTLATHGDRQQALVLYRKLLPDADDDVELLEAYAALLTTGEDRFELQEALQVWHRVEKHSKPGDPRWWRGRRARLMLLELLGQGQKAKKLRQLTEILYPNDVKDE